MPPVPEPLGPMEAVDSSELLDPLGWPDDVDVLELPELDEVPIASSVNTTSKTCV